MGATLVRRLASSGHSVRVFDNYSTGNPAYLDGVDAELVEGDIRDAAALDAALAGIESIIHLAAAGSVVSRCADPVMNFEANVLGTFRVLDAARRAGVERVVLASTGGALIGDARRPSTSSRCPSRSRRTGRASWPARGTRTPSPSPSGCARWRCGSPTSTARGVAIRRAR